MSLQFKLTLPPNRRNRDYQPLPIAVSPNAPSPSTPTRLRSGFRPRRINIVILGLTAMVLFLLGWNRPDLRNRVDGYLQYGQDRFTSWSDNEDGLGRKVWVERISEWKGGCRGWDPDRPEEEDPEQCMKARQYRQTMRVLEREERAEHEYWWFTLDHNKETFRNVSRCFLPTWHMDYTRCIDKPLIISGWWYTAETVTGATTGEVIWQKSIVKQLKMLGMHYAAVGPYENWVEVAELMPDVYRFIWMPDMDVVSCATDPRCISKEHYVPPDGADDLSIGVPDEERGVVKLWQMLVVDYWGARPDSMSNTWWYWGPNTKEGWSYQPLGPEWIATPWPLPGHFHLAYSIEDWCLPLPIKSHEERNDTVLLFAKRSSYFTWPRVAPPHFFTDLAQDSSFDLVLTAKVEDGHPLPEGLTTLGPQTQDAYSVLVGESKVLLGIGQPMISPSVYTALCQATPVVLPYARDDPRLDGWHLFGHSHQHGPASLIGPPYVYSYYESNYTSLVEAVHQAFATPIDRYIPADMKLQYALTKTKEYITRDLEGMFNRIVSENKGRIPGMAAGIRERCYELERCRDTIKPGTKRVTLKSGSVVRTETVSAYTTVKLDPR